MLFLLVVFLLEFLLRSFNFSIAGLKVEMAFPPLKNSLAFWFYFSVLFPVSVSFLRRLLLPFFPPFAHGSQIFFYFCEAGRRFLLAVDPSLKSQLALLPCSKFPLRRMMKFLEMEVGFPLFSVVGPSPVSPFLILESFPPFSGDVDASAQHSFFLAKFF